MQKQITTNPILDRLKFEADMAAKQVPSLSGLLDSFAWLNPLTLIGRIVDEILA